MDRPSLASTPLTSGAPGLVERGLERVLALSQLHCPDLSYV